MASLIFLPPPLPSPSSLSKSRVSFSFLKLRVSSSSPSLQPPEPKPKVIVTRERGKNSKLIDALSHPNAQGMRNKPFPHFEDLTNVFRRDRATRMGAEAPAGAVEEIEMEEQQYRYTLPTINKSQERESNFVRQNFNMNTLQTATNTKVAGPSRPTKTKKARHEGLEVVRELTSEMTKLGSMMAAAGNYIEKLASCFKHESETVDRRMAVVSEVMKVQDLSQSEILKMGRKIAMDPLETDYFFSLPEDYRRAYILTFCSEFQSGM